MKEDRTNPVALANAKSYVEGHRETYGLKPFDEKPSDIVLSQELGQRVGKLYQRLPHAPEHPKVKASYDQMKREVLAQYLHLSALGVHMIPWTQPGQPYKNSKEMREDVKSNSRLYYFPTLNEHEKSYGEKGEREDKSQPLLERTGIHVNGYNQTYNDLFRAVHDYFGHAVHGHEFGPQGEVRAWHEHAKMFSAAARPALSMETHGQNSWVNFGPHNPQGLPATQRPFAEQKANVLPEKVQPKKLARMRWQPVGNRGNQVATGGLTGRNQYMVHSDQAGHTLYGPMKSKVMPKLGVYPSLPEAQQAAEKHKLENTTIKENKNFAGWANVLNKTRLGKGLKQYLTDKTHDYFADYLEDNGDPRAAIVRGRMSPRDAENDAAMKGATKPWGRLRVTRNVTNSTPAPVVHSFSDGTKLAVNVFADDLRDRKNGEANRSFHVAWDGPAKRWYNTVMTPEQFHQWRKSFPEPERTRLEVTYNNNEHTQTHDSPEEVKRQEEEYAGRTAALEKVFSKTTFPDAKLARIKIPHPSDLAHHVASVMDAPHDNNAHRILADRLMEEYPEHPVSEHYAKWVQGEGTLAKIAPHMRNMVYHFHGPLSQQPNDPNEAEYPHLEIRPTDAEGIKKFPLSFSKSAGDTEWTPRRVVTVASRWGRTVPGMPGRTRAGRKLSSAEVAQHLLNCEGPQGAILAVLGCRHFNPEGKTVEQIHQRIETDPKKIRFARKPAFRTESPAAALSSSMTHNADTRRHVAEQIIKEAGLHPAAVRTVLAHEQGKGVRSTVITAIQRKMDPAMAKYIAAWFGLLSREKALTVFAPHDAGSDRLHVLSSQLPVDEMGDYLNRAGIPKFSVEENGSGSRAFVFSPQGQFDPHIQRVTRGLDASTTSYSGTGFKLGSGEGSDADARAKYRDSISDYENTVTKGTSESTGPTS